MSISRINDFYTGNMGEQREIKTNKLERGHCAPRKKLCFFDEARTISIMHDFSKCKLGT